MKPRTKHEKHVVELAAKLPALTPSQVSYLREKCYKHQAVKRCGKYYCLDCGAEWPASTKEAQLVDAVCGVECPECGHHLQVEVTRKRKWSVGSSFQMVTVAGDCQVLRLFEVNKSIEVGKPAYYWEMEAVQIFIKQDKPEVVLARPINMNCYNNSFAYTKEISIKQTGCRYYSYTKNIYYETGAVVYPRRKVLPVLKRNGYSKKLYNLPTYDVIHALLNNPKFETLVKAGRYDIINGMSLGNVSKWWPQVKMLIRHDYHPADVSMWKDTLDMANDFHLDTHSPKYVLPDDLTAVHDKLVEMVQAKRRREEEERQRREEERRRLQRIENVKYNQEYIKFQGKLLGVCIVVGDITIKPLQNYAEFVAEGKAMHHCVETYWKHRDCLILSARSGDKRLATIELNRRDFSVVQCRAVCNGKPERYDEILSILTDHKKDFIKAVSSARHWPKNWRG